MYSRIFNHFACTQAHGMFCPVVYMFLVVMCNRYAWQQMTSGSSGRAGVPGDDSNRDLSPHPPQPKRREIETPSSPCPESSQEWREACRKAERPNPVSQSSRDELLAAVPQGKCCTCLGKCPNFLEPLNGENGSFACIHLLAHRSSWNSQARKKKKELFFFCDQTLWQGVEMCIN